MEPLPREILEAMYQALHKQCKCFTGHHMVMWLLVHYYKAHGKSDEPSRSVLTPFYSQTKHGFISTAIKKLFFSRNCF